MTKRLVFLPIALGLTISCQALCIDEITNVVRVTNADDSYPLTVRNVTLFTYDVEQQPSCYDRQPSVLQPGYVKISNGTLQLLRKFDIENTFIRLTLTRNGKTICHKGEAFIFLLNSYCTYRVIDYIPTALAEAFADGRSLSAEKLEEKIGLKPTMEIPPSPHIFLVGKIVDWIKGSYHVEIGVYEEDQEIGNFALSTQYGL